VSLVPPAHICLVRASDVVEDLSEALGLLSSMPSAVAWISGPSRSADLEMTLTLGVHGPGSVDVVVIDDSE
ncbi:MAG: LUD domain-containing protein, partial [Acidimicrobiia bacterium]